MRALATMSLVGMLAPGLVPEGRAEDAPIHCVTDISHEFTFYFDGRFGNQYVVPQGGKDVRNWGTLHTFPLDDANLLILQSGGTPCPYTADDETAVREFLTAGGGVVLLGDHAVFRDEKSYRLDSLAREFGATFTENPAIPPLRGRRKPVSGDIEYYGGKTLGLKNRRDWEILAEDANGKPVLVRRRVGKGQLVVASRGLCGRQPDAKDPINAAWWQPLLREAAAGKPVDPGRTPADRMPENVLDREGLSIRCSNYLKPMADIIFEQYSRSRPALEEIMGVPPADGMLASLILLPTGGGGFSSGRTIGLGIWWGDFPDKQYGMVELLGHEATHSWVLPFPEPMWNEGIATYVGILLGRRLGYAQEADATLRNWIEGARKHDPDMTAMDLTKPGIPHAVAMAKPMWIFEQLAADTPDILARYFREKRKLIDPDRRKAYTPDDCVAVLSRAAGKDLFPQMKAWGIDADPQRTDIPVPEGRKR